MLTAPVFWLLGFLAIAIGGAVLASVAAKARILSSDNMHRIVIGWTIFFLVGWLFLGACILISLPVI